MRKIRFKVTFDPSKTSPSRIVKRVEDLGYRLKGKHYPTVGVLEAIRLAIRRSRARKPSKS